MADRALFGLWAFFFVTRCAGGGEMGVLGGPEWLGDWSGEGGGPGWVGRGV